MALNKDALGLFQAFVTMRVARVGDLHVYLARYAGELARHRQPQDESRLVLDGDV